MTVTIMVDGKKSGRTYQGIGGVTSNGMTKLLYEYPENQQKDILNFLFRPKFGASLQMLKVEIGSDANGTGGTEPSHMRSETDYDITRGVGLRMAQDAKQRSKDILLDAIRWGTPSWLTDNERKYRYYLNFLKGAKDIFGLDFDYLAPDENEGDYSIDWVVDVLRPGLDRDGFSKVKLSGADSTEDWNIAPIIEGNADLKNSLAAITRHYKQDSPQSLKECGLPIFNSEDLAPFRNKFSFALDMAYKIIRSYASGKMVQYVMHPVIEAIYDNVPYTCKSILLAANPWTGHYEIQPSLWVVAHFTQFIQLGWHYIDSACYSSVPYSYLTLQDSRTQDVSIIVLNRSEAIVNFEVRLENISASCLHVWLTDEDQQFIQKKDIRLIDNKVCFSLVPKSICTLTTTTGQQKGHAEFDIPKEMQFSLPYHEDFNSYELGKQPKYTIDQSGAFEISTGGKDGRQCLKQVLVNSQKPIDWERRPTPLPYTILGGQELTNYKVSFDFCMEEMPERDYVGYVLLGARCNHASLTCDIPECYNVRLYHNGRWFLSCGQIVLAAGRVRDFSLCTWHELAMCCEQDKISAFYNGTVLATIVDQSIPSGNSVIGSGYNIVKYDNFKIEKTGNLPETCRRYSLCADGIEKTGKWTEVGNAADNYYRTLLRSSEKGDQIAFAFTGTALSLIGVVDAESGKADIYIDKGKVATIDCFSTSKMFRRSLFSIHGLESGVHEFRLVVSGVHQDDALGSNINLNAIELIGGLVLSDCSSG
ncbi:galactosylceramidase [Parasphaerochaeta coccoides]|uniref:galactosylceramidase n=1 Tax=Parasphaerochaeta coccoides (strain ATCC BAA-1237 / DSM 17374 / SPN1) TaxID=760011 RepID=F4GHS5_PARC1|nr:galactosylceramidase [Parasphaerochaeta coccoides]AEC01613.1 Galactosylceramidase [Parasphaerochaeta coccoides DSM 17374]